METINNKEYDKIDALFTDFIIKLFNNDKIDKYMLLMYFESRKSNDMVEEMYDKIIRN